MLNKLVRRSHCGNNMAVALALNFIFWQDSIHLVGSWFIAFLVALSLSLAYEVSKNDDANTMFSPSYVAP